MKNILVGYFRISSFSVAFAENFCPKRRFNNFSNKLPRGSKENNQLVKSHYVKTHLYTLHHRIVALGSDNVYILVRVIKKVTKCEGDY